MEKNIKIGLFGLGTVGSGLVEVIRRRSDFFKKQFGLDISIKTVVVKDLNKNRKLNTSSFKLSNNREDILNDPEIDIVVELIGGTSIANEIVSQALVKKKNVVTANKALMATKGYQLLKLANEQKCLLLSEAAVGGGIPILKTLKESFVGNDIIEITAILNGTSNFILTKMAENGLSYYESLKLASEAGFAETDPTMDVDGTDTQQKLRILAAYISGGLFPETEISYRGIKGLTPSDFEFARKKKKTIKLLAKAKKRPDGLQLKVEPTLIPYTHPLANIRNEYNAILIEGDNVGRAILSGKGAGSLPTASAVFADIMDIYRGGAENLLLPDFVEEICSATEVESEYYLRFVISDKPGMIGAIATILGQHAISVYSTSAELIPNSDGLGQVHVLVHKTSESQIKKALEQVVFIEGIHKEVKYLPIEND